MFSDQRVRYKESKGRPSDHPQTSALLDQLHPQEPVGAGSMIVLSIIFPFTFHDLICSIDFNSAMIFNDIFFLFFKIGSIHVISLNCEGNLEGCRGANLGSHSDGINWGGARCEVEKCSRAGGCFWGNARKMGGEPLKMGR